MKPLAAAAFSAAIALLSAPLAAEPLPTGDPAALGFDPARLAAIDSRLTAAIEAGDMPGASILIARHGQIVHASTLGQVAPDGPPMGRDAIFRIYSMTKPITSVAIMMLAEQGRLSMSDPVARFLPELGELTVATGRDADGKLVTEPAKRKITLQDLMRHSAGLTYGFFGSGPAREEYLKVRAGDPAKTNMEMIAQLAALPLEHQPGEVWEYSRATDVLGAVVEAVTGQTLGEALDEMIFAPLGMDDTAFWVEDPAQHARIAEPYPQYSKVGPYDFSDPRERTAFESGGGGLVSTLDDYSRFAQMLLNGGELDGARLLSPQTVAYMTSDHLGGRIKPGKYYLPGAGYGFGLGVAVRLADGVSPDMGVAGEYRWGGAAGTAWWNDPVNDLQVVFMIQSRPKGSEMRPWLKSMVYAAMTDAPPAD
ncbi:MAG: serine hydrolase domain-containing protein [Pseudomonadota bacterium]|nr:serine hydrolase domain-containing protein [Pseudomonadota bacterium]MEE3102111.1 serine hydrolase domain-containing protein [Pseudomonadota bacterium]